MDQRKDAQMRFWIRTRDSLGNPIDQRLIESAHRIWEHARFVVVRYLADDTEAPEILEIVVDSASRVIGNHHSIQFFDAYLLRSVAREAIRRYRRSKRIAYLDTADLERLAGPVSMDLDRMLDDSARIEMLRACMDEHVRKMYDLRVLGFDWGSIAGYMGYADAHSAEVQFRKKIDKAVERFRRRRSLQIKHRSNDRNGNEES
jgi:DNA-directed RNA polymerase specialized sigma24 family protein